MTTKSWVCSIAPIAAEKSANSSASFASSECAFGARDAIVRRQFELEARVLGPGAAVLDVMGEAFLPRVEIDGGDALAGLQQRDRDMHRGGRFAGAALLVAEHDDMAECGSSLDRWTNMALLTTAKSQDITATLVKLITTLIINSLGPLRPALLGS